MEATLVVVEGEAHAPQFRVNLPAIIGRSRNADLKLGQPLVSRQHCELFEADGNLMVRDLGSLNGTFVGETRIAEETSVEPGGLLTIGSVTFRAEYEQAAQASDGHGEVLGAAFAPFAAEAAGGVGEETIQAGAVDELGQMHGAESSAEGEDGFGWLDDNAEAAPAATTPAAADEEMSFDEPAAFGESEELGDMPADEPLNFDEPPAFDEPVATAEAPAEEEEALDEVDIVDESPAAESELAPMGEAAGDDEFNLDFGEQDDTAAAEAPAKNEIEATLAFQAPLDLESATEMEAPLEFDSPPEAEAPAEDAAPPEPVAEDEFNFAPPEEENAGGEPQEGGDDLDDFFNNLK